MESTYRAWTEACNARNLEEAGQYLCSPFHFDGQDYSPAEWVDFFKATAEAIHDLRSEIDHIVIDEEAQCIATRQLVTMKPVVPLWGAEPTGRTISMAEMHFVWFKDGKMSRLDNVIDHMPAIKQLQDPSYEYEFASAKETLTFDNPMTTEELATKYDGFVAAINDRTMATEFQHHIADEMWQNEKLFPRDMFRKAMEMFMEAMPDVKATIRNKIVDPKTQRIIVQLELAGTAIKPLAGYEPTGRRVCFNEHVMYEWGNGKITRNWVLLDYMLMGKQLKGEA